MIYNTIKNNINNNNIKFLHKNDQNRKKQYNHNYQRLYVEYNLKYIITKQYYSYESSSGSHYSDQWYNKEVIYELCPTIHKKIYKFYKFIPNIIDKFDFYIFSSKILIIERIDSNSGWGDFLKIKIINEDTNKELLLNVGSSINKEKIINLNDSFFDNVNNNIIKYYTFYNENIDKKFNISICKNKYNIEKLIIIHNDNIGWIENFKLNIVLNNDEIYNINIGASKYNIKIIDFKN